MLRQERDNVIYTTASGKFCRTANPIRSSADAACFVIICPFGDWGSFRSLADCEAEFPALEKNLAEYKRLKDSRQEIPRLLRNHAYEVVER